MKVHLWPPFEGEDKGDGGVRRVYEGQRASMPRLGVQFVDQAGDADVIGCHISAPDQYLRLFPDKPLIAHCHGLYWSNYQWENWSYKANQEVLDLIMCADAVTAPSHWVADVIRRHTSRDVRVIYHGVKASEFKPAESRGYVLWNKTRLDPICSPDALNDLAIAMPDTPFVSTYGDDFPNLQVVGRVPYETMKELVRHAGAYLCTTRETFGIGTIEAMAAGVPVVGYDFGGQSEFIEQEVDGWLVEEGDIDGLRRGVHWALANRETAGAAARKKAAQFTWGKAAEKYHALYREVIDWHERYTDANNTPPDPNVTIVVPAYNLAKYLPQTLDSIKAQSSSDWECIIVDDASPDDCGAIADRYAAEDSRFRVIHNETNLYLAESRNVAIEQAKGRYILPVDADDMITPLTVATLQDALDSDRTLYCAYGNVRFVDEDGTTPTDYRVSGQAPGHSNWPMEMDARKQVSGMNLQPYASMFRREAWRLVGGYRRRLVTAEDADFWTRLASYGFKSEYVTKADTLIYRNREGSMSRTQDVHRHDYVRWYPWAANGDLAPAGVLGRFAITLYEPNVAVIIPVGPGHEKLVQDAVDSVAAQSYPDWECIVVNDSGKSLHLPSWVRVVECSARDVGAARNLGVRMSRAPVFLPLDADDYLQPDALQWLMSASEDHRAASVVYPDFYEDPDQAGRFSAYRLPDWECSLLTRKGTVHAVTALTSRAAWERVGGYSEEGHGWEDWDFQLRCADAGICSIHLAAPLFTYRKWTGARRSYDESEFERRKEQILSRWADYFTGSKSFMACNCSGGGTAPQSMSFAQRERITADAVLMEYVGEKQGALRYRGPTGRVYTFAKGESPRWVAGDDVPLFTSLRDFRMATATPVPMSEEPTLTA